VYELSKNSGILSNQISNQFDFETTEIRIEKVSILQESISPGIFCRV
jgi:hypothetical protein